MAVGIERANTRLRVSPDRSSPARVESARRRNAVEILRDHRGGPGAGGHDVAGAGVHRAIDRPPRSDRAELDLRVGELPDKRHGFDLETLTRRRIERSIGVVVGGRRRRANQVGVNVPFRLTNGAELDKTTEPDGPPRSEVPRQSHRSGHRPGIEGAVVRASDT